MANTRENAARALEAALASDKPAALKLAALRSMRSTRVTVPAVIVRAGELGVSAIRLNLDAIRLVANSSTGGDLAASAQKLIDLERSSQ